MFYSVEKSKIKYYKSSIIEDENIIHAFTTRIGGNTPPPLNDFSLGTTGLPEFQPYIDENKSKICEALEVDQNLIVNPNQTHSDNIKIVTSPDEDLANTDGVITETPGLVLMLLFADCTPIILYTPKRKVIAVIHAGWRGTAQKIAQKAINSFDKDFKVDLNEVKAAIGPTIGQCCYPVSEETAIKLSKSISNNHDNIFKNDKDSNKIRVDLKELNKQQLVEIGIKNIDVSNYCTSCNNELFYSYRADNGKTGRHGAIASLK